MDALVFFGTDNTHWMAPRLHAVHKHVWCAIRDPNGYWVETEVSVGGIVQRVVGPDYDLATHYGPEIEVWAMQATPEDRQLMPSILNSCVGVTKSLLGIRHWSLTPYQMRKHLSRGAATCVSI